MFGNPNPNKDNIPLFYCPSMTAFDSPPALAGSDAWRLDRTCTPPSASLSYLVSHRDSLLLSLPACVFLSLNASQVFLSTDAHFSLRSVVVSRFSPLPRSLPPPSLFSLCVRVCRWLLLAGSVTRGNWGRVHFNGTNGNKLIHFHCCF